MSGPPPGFDFNATWGCQFTALCLNAILYGAAMLLVLLYFRSHSRNDTWKIKALVGLLGFLATVQITFLCAQLYVDFVTRFGNFEALFLIPFEVEVMLLSTYFLAFTAQIFFATRVWIITKHNIWYTTPIFILALMQIGAGIGQTTILAIIETAARLQETERVITVQCGATAACDALITIILCYTLHNKRSGIKRTDSILDKLILYAINRGVVTSLAAFLTLVFFIAFPGKYIFMIPLLPSSQLYVLSVVSTLTTRQNLRDDWAARDHATLPLGSIPGSKRIHDREVHVTTSVVTWDGTKDGSQPSDKELKVPVCQ